MMLLPEIPASPCFARRFDLQRNSPSTVSPYADEGELLVLVASCPSQKTLTILVRVFCDFITDVFPPFG